MRKFLFQFSTLLLSIIIFSSCVDHEFDEPPVKVYEDPNIEVTNTIADVKALHVPGIPKEIEDDMVIKGTVISYDEPGNFYKKLVIQDETGGFQTFIPLAFHPENTGLSHIKKGTMIAPCSLLSTPSKANIKNTNSTPNNRDEQ